MNKKQLILHPFLFAIYPVMFLYSYNLEKTPVKQVFRPFIIIFFSVLLLWFISGIIIKDKNRSALICSLFVMFGRLNDFIFYMGIKMNYIYLLVLTGIFFILLSYILLRISKELSDKITAILNVISLTLMTFVLLNIMPYLIKLQAYQAGFEERKDESIKINNEKNISLSPDIYYIILDSYARTDVLREFYGYDNSDFINYLKETGFYIADDSFSNYPVTLTSVPSSLNMGYLYDLIMEIKGDMPENVKIDKDLIYKLIQNNKIANFLKHYGYKIVSISSEYNESDLRAVDVYIQSHFISEFEQTLIDTTFLPYLLRNSVFSFSKSIRYRNLKAFKVLCRLTEINEPFFVFVDITITHFPFVFDEKGGKLSELSLNEYIANQEYYKRDYVKQAVFLESKLKELIKYIIEHSKTPPIIILQSDHGPNHTFYYEKEPSYEILKERMAILNAFYLPGKPPEKLYEGITPVNTFRIIFNHYFGTNMKIMEDKMFYATLKDPCNFIEVTGKLKGKK